MGWLAALGVGSFLGVSLVLGVRLLRLAARTRQLPELAIGGGFLLSGAAGYSLILGATVALSRAPHWTPWLWGGGLLSTSCGAAGVALFTWRVFRPRGAGPWLFAALVAAMAAGWVGLGLETGFDRPGLRGVSGWLGFCGRAGSFGWASVEAFRYSALLRRRLRLGLADPAAARRMLRWGVGAGAATSIFLHSGLRALLDAPAAPTSPEAAIPTAVLGVTAALAFWGSLGSARPHAA